jgi:hypothetical protein
MQCALCKDKLNVEHPNSVYCRNPSTFRYAWMHYYCFKDAYEILEKQESKKIQFLNRQDEYDYLCA